MARRTLSACGLVTAVVLFLGSVTLAQASGPTGARQGPSSCGSLVVSPQFTQDGTAVCVGWAADAAGVLEFVLWRTDDGGFSWRQAAARGLAIADQSSFLPKLAFSPMYEEDGRIFIGFYGGDGIWSSSDGGESFEVVDPFGTSQMRPLVTATDAPLPLIPQRRVMFAEAWTGSSDGTNNSALIDAETRLRTLVKGTPGRDKEFAISPTYESDGRAYAVGELGVGKTHHFELFACDAIFNCSEHLFTLPDRLQFDRVFFSSDFEESGTMFISTVSLDGGRTQIWRSDDAGESFEVWESVQKIFDDIQGLDKKGGLSMEFGVTGVPGTRILFVRIYYAGLYRDPATPLASLYRSTNGGKSWKLRAFGRLASDSRPAGTMSPYGPPPRYVGAEGLIVAPMKDRMFILSAEADRRSTIRCSVDGGRTWQFLCKSRLT